LDGRCFHLLYQWKAAAGDVLMQTYTWRVVIRPNAMSLDFQGLLEPTAVELTALNHVYFT